MSATEVLKKYDSELRKNLPMEDSNFLQILENCEILPGDIREKIQAKKTNDERADVYIKHIIGTSPDLYLPSLLQAMEQYHPKYADNAFQDLLIHMIAELNGMFDIRMYLQDVYICI